MFSLKELDENNDKHYVLDIDLSKDIKSKIIERYLFLNKFQVKNVKEFYLKYPERKNELSYITIFIDEYADLIMQNNKIENYIISLIQFVLLIHMILMRYGQT